jgi:hypothetical protein
LWAAADLWAARPVSNVPPSEKEEQVRWALDFLTGTPEWSEPIVAARVAELEGAHARLRKLTKTPRLKVQPHVPPDILGCFVLLPTGGVAA